MYSNANRAGCRGSDATTAPTGTVIASAGVTESESPIVTMALRDVDPSVDLRIRLAHQVSQPK